MDSLDTGGCLSLWTNHAMSSSQVFVCFRHPGNNQTNAFWCGCRDNVAMTAVINKWTTQSKRLTIIIIIIKILHSTHHHKPQTIINRQIISEITLNLIISILQIFHLQRQHQICGKHRVRHKDLQTTFYSYIFKHISSQSLVRKVLHRR